MLSLPRPPSLPSPPLSLSVVYAGRQAGRICVCITRSSIIMFKSAEAADDAGPRLRRARAEGGGGAGLMGALTSPCELRRLGGVCDGSVAAAAGTGADERTAGSGNDSGN